MSIQIHKKYNTKLHGNNFLVLNCMNVNAIEIKLFV